MKKSKKILKHVLSLSVLLSLSSMSFADLVIKSSGAASSSTPPSSITWSSEDVNQLLNDDHEVSPKGSTSITTSIVRSNGTNVSNPPSNTVRIYDTNKYVSQPSVNARAALVMDAQTGEVLYSKNTNTALPIASVTKLMTAVVTADARLNMSENIILESIDFAGAGGKNSSSTLKVGDSMNRAEMLLLALMKSENPAAAALARTYPGGRPAFVSAMNAKARQLGMTSTHYTESTGLDPRNIASARDLGILVSSAYEYGLIRQFSTTASYDFNLGYRVLKSNNTNAMVRNGGWNINISKTGYINEAGRCVVMHTTVNSRPAVVVLLGASTSQARTNDATNLLNWVSSLPKRI
ncbi:D-alanyl-D-alanine endopeptidase (penicillin-binding protein 7) [Acinetobacter calcoaceticus]|uniref:D-alanyl-D-alanine endopeptidase (Penicillin-binding protein 7) n=1 Tax=Acinetobacter calcoaceticus TaxID=471 RepID=A0A4R1Y1U5_ACICA|nr:D-alanyl-D-alanine endopeptidase (penicillin-binding protein 7) [Acinetobacter calcoaceticus]